MLEGRAIQDLIGRTLHAYRVEQFVAGDRAGAVFAAVQVATGRLVWLRCLHPYLTAGPDFFGTFEDTVRRVAEIDHPALARVLDAGLADEIYFLVSDPLEGERLRQQLIAHPDASLASRIDLLMRVLPQVAGALAPVHERGLAHGDLTPGALLLTPDGRVLVLDLGVAACLGAGEAVQNGMLVNLPEYMAPEQCEEPPTSGPATDQYVLALITYEMLVGQAPFQGATPSATMRLHRQAPPPSPRAAAPGLPEEAAVALLRALAKRPEERYPTLDSFVGSLALALATTAGVGLAASAPPVSPAVGGAWGEWSLPAAPSPSQPSSAPTPPAPPPAPAPVASSVASTSPSTPVVAMPTAASVPPLTPSSWDSPSPTPPAAPPEAPAPAPARLAARRRQEDEGSGVSTIVAIVATVLVIGVAALIIYFLLFSR